MMEKFQAAMEKSLIPVANKLSASKILRAISRGFSALLPIIMVGAIASLLSGLNIEAYQTFITNIGLKPVISMVSTYTTNMIALYAVFSIGKAMADQLECKDQSTLAGLITLLMFLLVIPTGGDLIALFGAGDEAIAIGDQFFRRIACFYVIYGLAMAVRSYLEGMGDVAYSSLAGMAALVCRILLSYTLVEFFANMVIAYAEAFSWVLLLLLYLLRAAWKEHRWNKETQFEP